MQIPQISQQQDHNPFANLDDATKAKVKAIFDQVKAGTLTQEEANTQLQALGVNIPLRKSHQDQPGTTSIATQTNNIGVSINGEQVVLDPSPTMVNGSTFIPLRGVFEKLNATVQWDSSTNSATVESGTNQVKVTIDSNTAYVNGNAVTLATALFVQNGSTFVPLRFISQSYWSQCILGWCKQHGKYSRELKNVTTIIP